MNIFNEGLIDTELFWLSFGDIISNVVISTVIVAEIGFVIWLLLKWLRGNVNINWSPVLNIEESGRRRVDSSIETFKEKVMKDMGPVEVGVKKKIIIWKQRFHMVLPPFCSHLSNLNYTIHFILLKYYFKIIFYIKLCIKN